MPDPQQPLVYSVDEVAAYLHRSPYSVYADVATGRIPAIKWGERSICIPRQALEQFLVAEAFRQQAERQQPTEMTTAIELTPRRRGNRARAAS